MVDSKDHQVREKLDSDLLNLALAKANLLESARRIDILKTLRAHPVMTVAAAASLGVVAAASPSAHATKLLGKLAGPAFKSLQSFAAIASTQILDAWKERSAKPAAEKKAEGTSEEASATPAEAAAAI